MATRSAKIDQKADLIWAIADKLTGVYKPHEYGDVILPLTVIRRFDCILSDTKDAVLQKYKNSETLDYIALKDIVFKEIEEYISTLNINDEFELYDASETFRNIPMTKEGKPNVNRAKLGRLFGQSIGKKPFENVERVYIANGNVKKSRYNKATMFKRTK